MHCKISDCFNCPYPDCINDSFYDYKLSDKQKARHNELALGRLEQRRANGICTYCGKIPADKGYKTCAECRRKLTRHAHAYCRTKKNRTAREIMDGISLCKMCGKRPPIERKKLCEKCYEICVNNLPAERGGKKLNNDFAKGIENCYLRDRNEKR